MYLLGDFNTPPFLVNILSHINNWTQAAHQHFEKQEDA